MRIELPWPARELHPNTRCHWTKRCDATKGARELAAWQTKLASANVPKDGKLIFRLDFYPPDKRHRDDDGLIASCKAYRDGVADGLGTNDRRFITRAELHDDEVRKGGCVVVTISPAAEALKAMGVADNE